MVFPHLDVPHDVLAHHNGVVNQNADGHREAEQRHRVEREVECVHGDEAREYRHRQGEARDHGRTPRVEKQEHHQHREECALDQRLFHVRHRALHAVAGVLHDIELRARRKCRPERLNTLEDLGSHFRRAVPLRFLDEQTHRLAPIEQRG